MIAKLAEKANISETDLNRIHVYEAHNNKYYRECPPSASVMHYNDFSTGTTLYAALLPKEEIELGEDEAAIWAFHFDKDAGRGAHGHPFRFIVREVRNHCVLVRQC